MLKFCFLSFPFNLPIDNNEVVVVLSVSLVQPITLTLTLTLVFLITTSHLVSATSHDYHDALTKSILFFEGQRSGHLPPNQRLTWRADSAVSDGSAAGVDLSGGYYDAGDNVKFGFPLAFTTTMLAWSVIEFGDSMPSDELLNAAGALRWATDYSLKTVSHPGKIFVQVGDPIQDHNCWERPEDMDTARTVYMVNEAKPGSDIAGETAAALAAASMVFRSLDNEYSETLLQNAVRVFKFADDYKGAYSDDAGVRAGVCPFYCDFDGYQDELLWGAAWLRRASQDDSFLSYIQDNGKTLGADDNINEFGWDNKHAGLNVLVPRSPSLPFCLISCNSLDLHLRIKHQNSTHNNYKFRSFLKLKSTLWSHTKLPQTVSCALWYPNHRPRIYGTRPADLYINPAGSNMQHVTSIAFLLLTYANYLEKTSQIVNCGSISVGPTSFAFKLKNREYTHRGSSLPSKSSHPKFIACKEGSVYYNSSNPNPNPLIGAVVGGPGEDDVYQDDRADFRKSEPTTYINAPLVGALAYFVANPNLSA
ncbi:putative cellulase [Dioscorea sansibarensis]